MTSPPQFNFSLGNPPPQSHTIYVSGETGDNDLSLLLWCTIDAEVTPATLVPQIEAGDATGSLFYLDLTPLGLDAAVLENLKVSAAGWATKLFSDEMSGDLLALTPAPGAPLKLQALVPVSFSVGNFAMATTPSVRGLTLMTYNVAGVATDGLPAESYSGLVFAQPPSGKADLADALTFAFSPADGVGASIAGPPEIANTLKLTLSAVHGAAAARAGPNALFTLQPAYGKPKDDLGFGALMTVEEGAAIDIPSASGWKTTSVDETGGRIWHLRPPEGLLPGPEGEPVQFHFGPVVTYYQAGPTVLLLSYSDVPGFADGAFAATIDKQAHVVINSFSVDPEAVTLTDGRAKVTASWDVSNSTRLTLQGGDPEDVSRLTSQDVFITRTTELRLVAEGFSPGSVDNVARAAASVEVEPVIEAFAVHPSAIWPADCNPTYAVNLSWDVNTNDPVTLEGSLTGALGSFPARGCKQVDVTGPQAFTLTASGVSATIDLAALKLETQILTAGNNVADGAFSPFGPFLAVTTYDAGDAPYNLEIYSTESRELLTTIALRNFPGAVAFSPDGSTLLVALQDRSVAAFLGGYDAAGQLFAPLPSIAVQPPDDQNPCALAVGTNGTACILFRGRTGAGSVAILKMDESGCRYTGSVTTGGGHPFACVLMPDATTLHIANSDGFITCVDLSQSPPTVATPITGLGRVTGITISPDGRYLLVVREQEEASILSYELSNMPAPPRTMPLADARAISALGSGDYAVVTINNGPIALINVARWHVCETAALGWPVPDIVTSPDGSLAMVPNFGTEAGGFAIISLLDSPPRTFAPPPPP